MDTSEKCIIGGIVFLLVFIAGGASLSSYYTNKERTECRKQGLDANKTVDEIVLLCNLPHRRK